MISNLIIRPENPDDYKAAELMTMRSLMMIFLPLWENCRRE